MALVGYQRSREDIEEKIADLQRRLGVHLAKTPASFTSENPKTRRTMSVAARKRIAEAQKKRWAAFHAKAASAKKAEAPKKKISPARRAALVASLIKARAARAAQRAAAK